jgi:hypothetical protein
VASGFSRKDVGAPVDFRHHAMRPAHRDSARIPILSAIWPRFFATFPIHTTIVDTVTPVTISATYRTTAAAVIRSSSCGSVTATVKSR